MKGSADVIGGERGLMFIKENSSGYDVAIGSLAVRSSTLSKPLTFYLIHNQFYNREQSLKVISADCRIHYNLDTIKQDYLVFEADNNVYEISKYLA